MRICPTCGNSYTDDANFCPMDASRLPPPAAVAPAAMPDATLRDAAKNVGGRFLLAGDEVGTPTGVITPGTDTGNGHPIAVKVVTPAALPTQPMQDRALRELKQLGKVTSDRVVKVLDQGRLDDGRVYVATEPVTGTPLDQLVFANGPLPIERAATIVLQVGEALTEAQKVGVIHRDVCPRNIFVGDGDRVKVGDFGLAEPVTDKVFGSPAYLSPEQVEGRPVDQRSNIYSLGAVFHFALTGEPPFSGDAQALLQAQLSSVPSPPSSKRAGLPGEIDRVILKALEKSGGRRHLTLRQLLTEIEAAAGVKAADAHKFAAQKAAAPAARPVDKSTVMGLAAMGGPAHAPAAAVPAVERPQSPKAASGARTMIAMDTAPLAPHVEAPRPVEKAAPEQKTAMAEAPRTHETPHVEAPRPVERAAHEQKTAMAEAPVVAAQKAQPAKKAEPAKKAQPAQKGQPAQGKAGGKGAGFRETAWFKQGEIDEELAKQAAAKASENPLEATGTTGKHAQVAPEDLSQHDRARLSLSTGATQNMPIIKGSGASKSLGDRMSDDEMLAEIDSSKKYLLVAGVVVAVVVVALILWLTVFRSSPTAGAPAPDKPTAVAAAPPAAANPAAAPANPAAAPAAPAAPVAAPAPAPPTKPVVADAKTLLAQSSAELRRDNLDAAVESYVKAAAAGAPVADLKKAEAPLAKVLAAKITRAKKRKDKADEAEARALLDRLRKKK